MITAKGFTLIELIVVIVLISIISAVGMGLFSSTDQYSARLASDRWLAGLRLAQRFALQKQNATNLVRVTVSNGAQDWQFSLDQGSTNLSAFSIEKKQLILRASTSDFTSACGDLPLAIFPWQAYFNGYGALVSASRAEIATNLRLCFDGAQSRELCMSPSGYSYEGTCVN